MATDVARLSYDWGRRYTGVAPQQGRVALEAEENEERVILAAERRRELLDLVGPAATPDGGYAVTAGSTPYDIEIGPGIIYVGGNRVDLPAAIAYSDQPDWLDHDTDPEWTPLPTSAPGNESVVLVLTETDVTATEDPVLREVALGGPDGAARTRFLQRVHRFTTSADDCSGALGTDQQAWGLEGLTLDQPTGELRSQTRLQVTWNGPPPSSDPCEPNTAGGYLGADNQAIRVQITNVSAGSVFDIVWGWDNASFLYRVTPDQSADPVLTLGQSPVDDYHRPASGQAVQVLRSAAQLPSTDGYVEGYVASLNGDVGVLTQAYDPDTKTVQFPGPLPSQYTSEADTPQLYMRVWQGQITGNQLGTAIELPGTGLSVTLTTESGAPPHLGDFWTIGVRPSTPSTVLPARLLREGQPPDGPRMWACPLAVIGWQEETLQVLADCRNPFPSGGEDCCCTVSVTAAEASAKGLQEIIDAAAVNRSPDNRAHQVTICLCPGRYELPRPLELLNRHSYMRIEGCSDGVVIAAAADAVDNFGQGLIQMVHANNVTLSGLEFELPQTPASAAKVASQERDLGTYTAPIGDLYRELYLSIGVRPVHCAVLEVDQCLFRFTKGTSTAASPGTVFGVGIFAGSECWGMRVERTRFLRHSRHVNARSVGVALSEEATEAGTESKRTSRRTKAGAAQRAEALKFAQDAAAASRATAAQAQSDDLLVGILLMPSVIFGQVSSKAAGDLSSGSLLRTLLTGGHIVDNEFTGLTVGIFAVAELGAVRIEDNEIRECYGGVWLLSIKAQAYADVAGGYTIANEVPLSAVEAARSSTQVVASDERAVAISAIARSYPLPEKFTPSSRDKLIATHVAAEEHKASQIAWMQQFLGKAFAPFRTEAYVQETPAAEQAEPQAPAPEQAEPQTPAPGQAEPQAPADNAPTAEFTAGGTPARSTARATAADTAIKALGAFDLSAAFFPESRSFELRLSGNDVECKSPFEARTGPALLVWDSDLQTGSALINNNRLTTVDAPSTALVVGIPVVLFNSNLVWNTNLKGIGLALLAAPDNTVSANVIQGLVHVPLRPSQTWEPTSWQQFNTELT